MIQIQLQLEDKTINLDPLDNVTIPSCLDLNDTLQHQESQVNIRVEYDSYIHKVLVENNSIPVTMIEDGQKIFTGIIDSGLSWVDNGTPEPLDNISLVIFDNSYKLQNTAETPITYINSSLTEIITNICNLCDLNFNDEGLLDTIKIPVFILNRDQEFYQAVNDLLFEYGFAFGFTGAGALTIINLKQPYDDQIIDNLFTGVKFSRTKRKYTGIDLNYGRITTKYNEQVYFEGGDLGENNKIVPIIITPRSYYPFESAPQIESTEGQVYQEFASGYAETQNLYNGEKRYTRSKDTQLLYTEDHNLVKDYSDNLTVDRTGFEYTQASVRFVNNSNEDAELKQLAIKATAYYRSPVQLVRGEGKKFKYDSKYIYDKDSANALAALMQHYFLGGNFKITFKTAQNLIPGQKTQINTGLSGITTNVIILSVAKDIYSEIYDITALTEQNISLDEKKWQIQKSMTASQQVLRESSNTANQLEKEIGKQIEDALANIGVDTRIDDITSADAILEEHQIQIKLNIDYDNFIGTIKDFIYELSMDNGVTFNEIKRVNSDIYNYPLPSIHRYKEKDYFENWKLRVKAQSQYDTYSENWFEFDIDTSNYGTWIPPKFDYDQVIAIANEQGINVNLNNKFPSDVKLYGSYNTIVEFSRNGEEWIEVKDNYIPFDRNIDGYPEKEQVEQYKIRVHRKSYLVDHPLMYTEKYVDATDYGTWIVQEPIVNTGVSGRTITLNIEQPQRADGLQPYGVIKYKVQVKRVTPSEDIEYYCPAQTLNPYDSEDNYKDVTSSDNYILVTNSFRQTMPLSGQNATEPLPVDTMYRFKITAINLVTDVEAEPLETPNLTALATSVKDIVAGAITTTKLADNCVTVDKIAVDTLVANESFMNELTAGIVNTGELSAEQISVYDFGYISGNNDNLKYKYLDKNGNEQTLTVRSKELFFGNRGYSDFSAEGIDKSDFIKMYEGATGKQLDISVSQFKASYQSPNNLDLFYKFVLSQGSLDADINMFKLNIHSDTNMGVGGIIKSDGAFTIRTAKGCILHLNSTTEDGEVYLPNAIFSRVTGNSFIANMMLQNCILKGTLTAPNDVEISAGNTSSSSVKLSDLLWHLKDTDNPHKVGKADIGLDKVNNTADSEKTVAYAEKAGSLDNMSQLTISSTADTSLTSWGTEPLSIGAKTGANIGIDSNEIQARNDTAVSVLYLNTEGGNVEIGKSGYVTTIKGNLSISGTTTMTGALTANGGISTSGTLNATGILKIPYTRPSASVISANPNGLTWIE